MRLNKLYVTNFGGIKSAEVEFGPGLNVLHGPNDLGKSTLVEAIRLGLLLPHGSTHGERFVGWSGGPEPEVEITFASELQRIWRVAKKFGKDGSSALYESRDGVDFVEAARGRAVDGKLRELLGWGIPEPGGRDGARGIPTSFLATALLSPQGDVGAVLKASLKDDLVASGKERIARALEAMAQDPRFVEVLRKTQERWEEGFTPKGMKSRAQGSVFKRAADLVNQTQAEMEGLQQLVVQSEDARKLMNDLGDQKTRIQEHHAEVSSQVETLERLAGETAHRVAAWEKVREAQEDLHRIKGIATDTENLERDTQGLMQAAVTAAQALATAKAGHTEAVAALKSAEAAVQAQPSQSAVTAELKLRGAEAEQRANRAEHGIEAAQEAQKLVEAVKTAEGEIEERRGSARLAAEAESEAAKKLAAANEALQRCDVLERAIDLEAAEACVAKAEKNVEAEARLGRRLATLSAELDDLRTRRAAINVPAAGALGPMRQLESELAAARGALDVGLVARVLPKRPVDLRVGTDGHGAQYIAKTDPIDIEADAEVDLDIGDVATIQIRGGRREAQARVLKLQDRWRSEVEPHLAAAGAPDLAGLDAVREKARELDTAIRERDIESETLRTDIAGLAGAAGALQQATAHAVACRSALRDIDPRSVACDLEALGADPVVGLRTRRAGLSAATDSTRRDAGEARAARMLEDDRVLQSTDKLNATVAVRDPALTAFPDGVEVALSAARCALAAAGKDRDDVTARLAALESEFEQKKARLEQAVTEARASEGQAAGGIEEAERLNTAAANTLAKEQGRLVELKRRLEAEDIGTAGTKLQDAMAAHEALPVPAKEVTEDEVIAARRGRDELLLDLEEHERAIERARGALQHVGGAVAGERLKEAKEAFECAVRQEKEIEVDYDAWKLLLETLKEADATQASNLGQALAPAIAMGFQELTRRRYDGMQLTAELDTSGILVAGAVRPLEHISVGTREQLSTLYRLALAEYLRSTIVLDDQLVQSDGHRMEWFRALLVEKAQRFQIVVFTCRPGDYLAKDALVPEGNAVHADTDEGLVRAVDLSRALHRRP
jgi:DNA repair exonuclease SbcCD ATPase subunit